MASLNTLRTKYGIVLSVVIALVLVAFILGDQLSMRGNGADAQNQGEIVMIVDGNEVTQADYQQYQQEYQETCDYLYRDMFYKRFNMPAQNVDPDFVAGLMHEFVVYNQYLKPAYEAAAIGYISTDKDIYLQNTANELMMSDPTITKEEGNEALNYIWGMSGKYAEYMLVSQRAFAIYSAGKYTNILEVENALSRELLSFDGNYVKLPYAEIVCDEVTAEEIDAYYNAHRQDNPYYNARTVQYVEFPIAASAADMEAAEAAINEANAAAVAAGNDAKAIRSALSNVGGKIGNYVLVSDITGDAAAAIKDNKNYGPVLNNNTWEAMYIVSKVKAPASYSFSAITADNIIAAEELVAKINEANGDMTGFENVTAGSIDMTNLNERDADKFINAKVGDVFVYTYNNKPAAIKITELGAKNDFVLTANVDYVVKPSKETTDEITKAAATFMSNAGDTRETFNQVANENSYRVEMDMNVCRLDQRASLHKGEGMYAMPIENSRSAALWAYDAKVGEKKSWTANNTIYVAMVTNIDENEYLPKNDFIIKTQLEKEKKFAAAQQTLKFEGKSEAFANVTVNNSTLDSALVNAIVRSQEGESAYVMGADGVYLFETTKVTDANDAYKNADRAAKRAAMTQEATRGGDIMEGVEIVDLRGEGEI